MLNQKQISKHLFLLQYLILRKIKVFGRWALTLVGFLDKKIQVRTKFIFVVGCSHSGTTLMATILGRNSNILALGNESYLFGQQYSAIKYGVKQWDVIAQQLSKKNFVEKTPKHVFEIGKILKILPSCKIIYIVRNAEDNIASLYKRNSDFSFSLKKYISDNLVAMKFENDKRVKKVFYESLVRTPETTVKSICDFIDVNFEPEMISEGKSVFENWGDVENKPNPSLRSKQVTRAIIDKTGESRKKLNRSQIYAIHKKLAQHHLMELSYENVSNMS